MQNHAYLKTDNKNRKSVYLCFFFSFNKKMEIKNDNEIREMITFKFSGFDNKKEDGGG